MSDSKFKIDLEKREDSYGKTFYIGKLKAPITIDCKDGVAFLIFTSDLDNEQMQISSFENKANKKPEIYTMERDKK